MSSFPLFSAEGEQISAGARKSPALVFERLAAIPRPVTVRPASRLEVRSAPEMVSSGVRELDALTGGLPRGCLTEVCGSASSGRTSVLLALMAAATRRQEACALVDVNDAFDPVSATSAGVEFERLLWVRCGVRQVAAEHYKNAAYDVSRGYGIDRNPAPKWRKREHDVEQALRVTDLLLQSGGFGLVVIDLGDVPFKTARLIPLTSWFRFQRAVECTSTVLLVITQSPCAQTCASLLLRMQSEPLVPSLCSGQAASGRQSLAEKPSAVRSQRSAAGLAVPAHTQLLEGLHVEGELLRSRLRRKPASSVKTMFATKALRIS